MFIYMIGVVLLILICLLGLVILLNCKIRGMKFFRMVFFFFYVMLLVVIVVVWNMLFYLIMGLIN